jgi:hypothetical protein
MSDAAQERRHLSAPQCFSRATIANIFVQNRATAFGGRARAHGAPYSWILGFHWTTPRAVSAFGGKMGIEGSRHRPSARGLAGAVATALALAAPWASADEVGESFWTPGSFGSLAATPTQPGFSLSSGYYHTATTAGSDVARARLIRIGRLSGTVEESVSAISISPEDLATVTPGYTFATSVLGGQAAIALTATYGRKRTIDDVTISGERLLGSSALTLSRFESISDTITGFGDLSPQASLRWNSGVHNIMTYMTGNIPVGAYDRARLSNIGIGHGAVDGGAGYTYFNEQTGYEFSAVAGLTYNFINPTPNIRTALTCISIGARRAS